MAVSSSTSRAIFAVAEVLVHWPVVWPFQQC